MHLDLLCLSFQECSLLVLRKRTSLQCSILCVFTILMANYLIQSSLFELGQGLYSFLGLEIMTFLMIF